MNAIIIKICVFVNSAAYLYIMYASIIGKFIFEIPKLSDSRMMLEDINAINVPECPMGQN